MRLVGVVYGVMVVHCVVVVLQIEFLLFYLDSVPRIKQGLFVNRAMSVSFPLLYIGWMQSSNKSYMRKPSFPRWAL